MSTEYTFDASVLGLGGYYVRDGAQKLVPSIASVVLAPTGGEGWSSRTNYDDGDIAFTHAESRVRGYETSPGFFTTISDIYITNLRMFDTVSIALLQATVTSTRNLANTLVDESEFQLHALYRGIDVEGAEIVPAIDVDVCHATYSKLLGHANDKLKLLAPPAPEGSEPAPEPPSLKDGDPVRASVVHGLSHNAPPDTLEVKGNALFVPGFAKLKFGDLVAKRGRRRISLLTFDFNPIASQKSAKDGGGFKSGSVTIASVGGNGEPVWPNG
jgi:hypothetical protein